MQENYPAYDFVKDSPKVLPMLYQDIAQPAVKKVGKALATVLDFSNTILLPLKLLNEKAKLNFQKHMNTYKEKLEAVDSEKIIDVPPIVGTPIIDRLTYITNDEIAELFINLLTKASSSDTLNQAHPAFIHMIDRLSVDEAKLITHFSDIEIFIPFIDIIVRATDASGYQKLAWDLTALEFDLELSCPENIDTYLNNLSSLKIIERDEKARRADNSVYEALILKYSVIIEGMNEVARTTPDYNDICEIQKGFFEITELGRSFMKACKV